MPQQLTLLNAGRYGSRDLVDIAIRDGRIAGITPAGSVAPEGETVNLDGRSVGPGLWDSHVHFTQWIIRNRRVDLSGTRSAEDVLAAVQNALDERFPRAGADSGEGVLVGYGFRDGLWPTPPSLASLEAVTHDVPVILVSGDLHCAWMNRRAAARFGIELDATGLVAEMPWLTTMPRLLELETPTLADFQRTADTAASRGVVGVVDFEIADNIAEWPARVAAGVTSLRVETSVWPDGLDAAIVAGLRTGDPLGDSRVTLGLTRMGRLKIIVDGSLNTRTAWCWDPYPGMDPASPHACGTESVSISELRRLLERAHAAGIEPAVHAIGDRANSEVLDVFAELGLHGVVEHAQLLRADDIPRFAALGLVASVQPEHAMDDRDVADMYWEGRTGRAFPLNSLLDAGAELRLGSDAPVAPLDPWVAISAAVSRSRDGRDPWHPEQRVPLGAALAASARTSVEVGEPADLVVLDRDPFAVDPRDLRDMPVAATLLGGRFTWRAC